MLRPYGWTFLFVAQAEAFGDSQVLWVVDLAQVSQQSATLAYHLEQTTTTGFIFLIDTKMIRQLLDTARQNCDLHFRGACISIMTMIVSDEFGLNFFL